MLYQKNISRIFLIVDQMSRGSVVTLGVVQQSRVRWVNSGCLVNVYREPFARHMVQMQPFVPERPPPFSHEKTTWASRVTKATSSQPMHQSRQGRCDGNIGLPRAPTVFTNPCAPNKQPTMNRTVHTRVHCP